MVKIIIIIISNNKNPGEINMATDDRISFRAGDVRKYNIAKYKKRYREANGKEINNTDIMLRAIDLFLENEEDSTSKAIKECEEVIIKVLLGISRNELKNDEEYLDILKAKIEQLKSLLNKKY